MKGICPICGRFATEKPVEETVHAQLLRLLTSNLRRSARRHEGMAVSQGLWDSLERGIEALPLGTSEYSLAHNRLQNAKHYWTTGQTGATQYELSMLLGVLTEKRHKGTRTNFGVV